MKPEIHQGDLDIALPIIRSINPKVVVDIGTYFGGSANLWRKEFNPFILITIDIRQWATVDPPTHSIIGDSHSNEILDKVRELLGGREIDFLFIDGDHHYESVKQDFNLYTPMVKKGGLVALHDIIYLNAENNVPPFWNELKQKYDYIEIAQDYDTTGVGIITMGEESRRTEHGSYHTWNP